MFTQHLHEEARRPQLDFIEVDTTTTEDDLAKRVTTSSDSESRGTTTFNAPSSKQNLERDSILA